MIDGYTFARAKQTHWYCSKKLKGCKASVVIDKNQTILKYRNVHNHEPPEYKQLFSGLYVKIKGWITIEVILLAFSSKECHHVLSSVFSMSYLLFSSYFLTYILKCLYICYYGLSALTSVFCPRVLFVIIIFCGRSLLC